MCGRGREGYSFQSHFSCIQIIIYKSNQLNSQRKAEKIRLSEFVPGGCSEEKDIMYTVNIVVPPVPPTDLTTSSVCRVKYEIQVTETSSRSLQLAIF